MKIKRNKSPETKFDLLGLDFDDLFYIKEGLKQQKKEEEGFKENNKSVLKKYDLEHNENHIKRFGSKDKIEKDIQENIKNLEKLTLLIETIENRNR